MNAAPPQHEDIYFNQTGTLSSEIHVANLPGLALQGSAMTSICNYSHPELQMHDAMIHHKHGALFPYNPEFYDRVTGLYGPGAIYCWHLLILSLIINWTLHPTGDDGYRRPLISSDFLGVVAFPTFAATDAMVQAMQFLGMKHRALAIFCLRWPETDVGGFAKFSHTRLDLRDIPPDILELGRRTIDITGPLSVCYTFAFACAASFCVFGLVRYDKGDTLRWKPTWWTSGLLLFAYGYVVLILTIIHLSLGDIWISFFVFLYEAINPFLWFMTVACTLGVAVGTVICLVSLARSILARNFREICSLLGSLASLAFFAGIEAVSIASIYLYDVKLVPDLAVSVTERDQLATLVVGIATLVFTVYEVMKRGINGSTLDDGYTSEMHELASNV